MILNGRIPLSLLTEVPSMPGAFLRPDVAVSWEAVRADVHREFGWWPAITSTVDAYRPYSVQERIFRQRYTPDVVTGIDPRQWNGRVWWRRAGFAAAAVPGTSNHGMGTTVDVAGMRYGSTRFNQFSKVAAKHGWSNAEGRTVNEAWHWNRLGAAALPDVEEEEPDMRDDERTWLRELHAAIGAGGAIGLDEKATALAILRRLDAMDDAVKADTWDIRLALSNALPVLLGAARTTTDPAALAKAVVDAIPDDIAGAVLNGLHDRLRD